MAEARSAVSELRVTPDMDGNSWKEFFQTARKSLVRRYYRTRNSIRNRTWPTSTNNLVATFIVLSGFLLGEPDATATLNRLLWQAAYCLYLPRDTPRWLRAFIAAWIMAIVFFVLIMKVRQYILRFLLTYRGWMYEPPKKISKRTRAWAITVRLVSGYQPSLYSCQKSLPRLPVPPLHSTLEKLLCSLRPLCTDEEMEKLQKQAVEFEATLGPKLQRILFIRSWWVENYVSDWWEKYVYCRSRCPIAINSNYYVLGHCYWAPTKNQLTRAAGICHLFLNFKRMIDREELPPLSLMNTIPVCMAQYERLFSTTRIPTENQDEIAHWDTAESRHIIVVVKGYMYCLEVYDSKNQLLSPSSLQEQMEWIWDDAQQLNDQDDVSVYISSLTALPRDEWSKIRREQLSSDLNKETLDIVERSIFTLVLSSLKPKNLQERGKFLLHGDTKSLWFDKSLNVVVYADGNAGLNVEHTVADAPAMAHGWEYVCTREAIERVYDDQGNCMPMARLFKQGKFKKPSRLVWDITPDLKNSIQLAASFSEKNNNDLDLVVCDHNRWGKGMIKSLKLSPDAFIQLAIQLAYFKDAGKFVQTYEASATRMYAGGRTETVRSCTVESAAFARSVNDPSIPDSKKVELLRAACKTHQSLYRDAMNGKGIDRHLFALYVCCKGMGYESKFLESIVSRPWTLSTSQTPQQQQMHVPDCRLEVFKDKICPGGGFGPVSDEGYGVSYMLPNDDCIFFHVSSKHSCSATSSSRFMKNLFDSLEDIRKVASTAIPHLNNGNK